MPHPESTTRDILLARRWAWLKIEWDYLQLRLEFEQRFNPHHRPAGPGGGQFTNADGAAASSGQADRRIGTAPDGTPVAGAAGGRTPRQRGGPYGDAKAAQEVRLTVSTAQANAAMARLRAVEPGWREPAVLSSPDAEGEIAKLDTIRREAEARFSELGGPPPRAEPFNVCLPSNLGYRAKGAGTDVRTSSEDQFSSTLDRLLRGAKPTSVPHGYKGQTYSRNDGTAFGVRISDDHGPTLDVMGTPDGSRPPFRRVHQQ